MTCWPGSGSIPAGAAVAAPQAATARSPRPAAPRPRWGCAGPEARGVRRPETRALLASHISARRSQLLVGARRRSRRWRLVGTTVGYAALSKTVTLSLDGQTRTRSTRWVAPSATSSTARASRSATTTSSCPSLDEQVERRHPDRRPVRPPLRARASTARRAPTGSPRPTSPARSTEIGLRFAGADLSVSRGANIDRGGMASSGHPQDADGQGRRATSAVKQGASPALTVADALDEARRRARQARRRDARPRRPSSRTATSSSSPTSGSCTKHVDGEAIDFGTIERRTPRWPRARPDRPRGRAPACAT